VWLARQFGLGSLGELGSVDVILAGVLTIRFIQGQYCYQIGYCWLPLGIAVILRVLRFGRSKNIGVAAIILALFVFMRRFILFHFMLFVGALAPIIYSINFQRIKPFVKINLLPIRNLI